MVLLIHFVIFMLFIRVCNGIRCIDEIQLQFSSSELHLTKIETIFNSLKRSNNAMCQVYMEWDSITQKFMIKFGQSMTLPHLRSVENVYVHIYTSIISVNAEKKINQTSIKTIVHLVCYSNDKCDDQFVVEYFNRLIQTNYKNLESTIRPLILVQGDKKNECTIGNGDDIKPCYHNSCSWYYSMDTKSAESKCENIDLQVLPLLNLTTEIRMFVKHKEQEESEETKSIRAIFKHHSSIKFWCELNNCNNQKVGKLVKEA
ncbi:unnamed protein product, partial [Rotaria sp. Silwood2]